jgi:hypothetical protein
MPASLLEYSRWTDAQAASGKQAAPGQEIATSSAEQETTFGFQPKAESAGPEFAPLSSRKQPVIESPEIPAQADDRRQHKGQRAGSADMGSRPRRARPDPAPCDGG